MDEVGLREMRQNASDLVRRAEAGERLTITVAGRPAAVLGRPAAVLGPVAPRAWRSWQDIKDLFREPMDDDWETDRELLVPPP
ncbi:MAG TPA: type II toxin-antitoxin system prevent-host-death family antitoxin [Kineosporiaceae bacterium]